MEINFKSKNGYCPYFLYKNIKFYIQDEKQDDDYKYSLCSVNTETESFIFDSKLGLKEFLESKDATFKYNFTDRDVYKNSKNLFITEKSDSGKIKVKSRFDFKQESGWFDNYSDCLKWSKEYVSKLIKASEPEQLAMSV